MSSLPHGACLAKMSQQLSSDSFPLSMILVPVLFPPLSTPSGFWTSLSLETQRSFDDQGLFPAGLSILPTISTLGKTLALAVIRLCKTVSPGLCYQESWTSFSSITVLWPFLQHFRVQLHIPAGVFPLLNSSASPFFLWPPILLWGLFWGAGSVAGPSICVSLSLKHSLGCSLFPTSA